MLKKFILEKAIHKAMIASNIKRLAIMNYSGIVPLYEL